MGFVPVSREEEERIYASYRAQQQAVANARVQYAQAQPLALRVAQIHSAFPDMRASLKIASAQAGLTDEQIEALWRRQLDSDAAQSRDARYAGGWLSDIGGALKSTGEFAMRNVVKPTTRLTVAAAAFPFELATGTVASSASAIQNRFGEDSPLTGALVGAGLVRQDFEGGLRNPGAQTRLGQFFASPTADQGDGFFMGGDIEDRAYAAQREAMTIYNDRNGNLGRTFTVGRAAFGSVPGTPGRVLEGLTDAYMTLRLDPVNAVVPQITAARQARNLFRSADEAEDAAGLVRGLRTVVHGPTAQKWLDGADGEALMDSWMQAKSRAALWRATNQKAPAEMIDEAYEAIQAGDRVGLRQALDRHLGIDVMERPSEIIDGSRIAKRKYRPSQRRLLSRLPATVVDPSDRDDLALQLDRSLTQAKASMEDRDRVVDAVLGAKGKNDVYNALKEYGAAVKRSIIRDDPLRPDLTEAQSVAVDEMVRLFNKTVDDSRAYGVDELGHPLDDTTVVVGAADDSHKVVVGAGPQLWTELLTKNVVLPDTIALRQYSSNVRWLTALSKIDDAGDAFSVWDAVVLTPLDAMHSLWRSMMLLRVGAMFRNVGEAQASMAAAGYASMFKHPLEYLSYVTSLPRGKHGQFLSETLTGVGWVDEAATEGTVISRTTARSQRMRRDYGKMFTGGRKLYNRGERYFVDAYAEQIVQFSHDPIMRELALALRSGDPDAVAVVKQRMWDGDLEGFRRDLLDPAEWDSRPKVNVRQTLDTREGLDAWVDQVALVRLNGAVGGNPVLLDAIADQGLVGAPDVLKKTAVKRRLREGGVDDAVAADILRELEDGENSFSVIEDLMRRVGGFSDEAIASMMHKRIPLSDQRRASKELRDEVRAMADREQGLPKVFGREAVKVADRGHAWNRAVDTMWNLLYSTPSNRLSNHPGFKQFYSEELGRLYKYGDDATQKAIEKYVPRKMLARSVNKRAALPGRRGETLRVHRFSDDAIDVSVGRPQGAYFGIGDADGSPWRAGGGALSERVVAPANPLRVTKSGDYESAGEAALRAVLGRDAADRIVRAVLDDDDLDAALAIAKANGLTLDPADVAFLRSEAPVAALDAMGGAAARAKGHDAIIANADRTPEFVALRASALDEPIKPLTMDEIDRIAQRRALDQAKKVFYDLSSDEKVAVWETLRYIAPFGAAWQDATVRWMRYVSDNPNILRRLHQGLQGGEDAGVFHEDPSSGELMLNIPVPGIGGNALAGGIPIGMQGRVAGLNMIASVMPGVGPILQVPVVALAPDDTPGWQMVREVVAPFTSGKSDIYSSVLDSFTPGWADRLMTAGGFASEAQTKAFSTQVANNIRYLQSTGEYDMTDPAEIQRMVEKARSAAHAQYALRAVYQFFAPTAPTFNPKVETPDGRLADLYVLSTEHRERVNELSKAGAEDPEGEAATEFMAKYGENLYLLFQPTSYASSYGVVPTREFDQWMTKHSDAAGAYREIIGLYAPGNGEFDFDAFNRQFRTGARASYFDGKPGTFEEWVKIGQHRMAQIVYREQVRVIEAQGLAGDDLDMALANLKVWLHDRFPGWRSGAERRRYKLEVPDAILRLEDAAGDDRTKDLPGMESTRQYLTARRQAIAELQRAGLTFQDRGRPTVSEAKAALPLRLWLAKIGTALMLRDPYFVRVWDDLLSWEANISDAFTEASGVDPSTFGSTATDGTGL